MKVSPRIYLSGFFTVSKDSAGKKLSLLDTVKYWRKRSGAHYRCFSFPYVNKKAMDHYFFTKRMKDIYGEAMEEGDGIFMDSGAHSFHNFLKKRTERVKGLDLNLLRDRTIDTYVEFVKKDGRKWDVYANFDYKHDNEECFRVQQHFMKLGINPIPVVHSGPDMLEYLKRYAETSKVIALGTGGLSAKSNWLGKRKRFDIIFNLSEKLGVKLHGFAITQLSLMFMYPWFSVDSATWAKCSAFGKIIIPDMHRNTLAMVHISDHALRRNATDTSYNSLPKDLKRDFVRTVEESGFDFSKLRTSLLERYCYNASVYAKHVHELKEIVERTRVRWKSLFST